MMCKTVFLNCDFNFENLINCSGKDLGRDQVFLFFWQLYLYLEKKNIVLTSKLENLDRCDLILNVDREMMKVENRQWFLNLENRYWTTFDERKIYTTSERVYSYDYKRFESCNGFVFFPIPLDVEKIVDFQPTQKSNARYVMISGNKNFPLHVSSNNYSLRQQYIDFLKEYPKFDLYGIGWDYYYHKTPILHRIARRIPRVDKLTCYKGNIDNKKDLANLYDFCFSFENTSSIKGYVTEKVFDCAKIGAIPIIDKPIPELGINSTSAIITENFDSVDDVIQFCNTMTVKTKVSLYNNFICAIKDNISGYRDVYSSARFLTSQIEEAL